MSITTAQDQTFTTLLTTLRSYTLAANSPSQQDAAATLLPQVVAELTAAQQSDPTLFASMFGPQGTQLITQIGTYSQSQLASILPTLSSTLSRNANDYTAANPGWNGTPPATPGGGSTPGPPIGYTGPPLQTGTGGNPINLGPGNPIIPPGGTGTTQGGGTITNPGGGGLQLNGSPIGTPTGQGLDAVLAAWAQSVGLGALSGWITQQAQTLTGQGLSASDVINVISSTINTAPGFDALMPGYNQRIANGYSNTDPNTGAGIAGYIAYRQQVQAMAETAGMVPGTITAQDVGNAWAGDVSTTELSERITTEYTNAIQALPAVQNELQNYGYTAGITPGQLASYYLNPANTVATLQQQFNSAVVGAEGTLTGFGEIGQSQAYALQAFLSNQGQNNLSTGQAASFFSGSLGGGLNSLSVMAQTGFEKPELGTAANGPGTVSQTQLVQAGEGNAPDLLAVQRAAETRAAPSQGGGGLAANQGGAVGVGYGSQ